MTVNEQSYLLAKAAKAAFREADGDVANAVTILARQLESDASLRLYVATLSIHDVNYCEIDRRIGVPAGRA